MKRLFSGILFQILAGLVLNSIAWLIIFYKIKPTSEIVPLHYNVFYGTDFAGPGTFMYLIPGVGLIILALNIFFYRFSKNRERFSANMLMGAGIAVQLFILAAILFLKSRIQV